MEIDTEREAHSEGLNTAAQGRPPDAGGGQPRSSFRDTLMGDGSKASPKALEDFFETGKMKVSYINDNRQLPKLHVDKSVIDGMCSPWKDALVVGLLGKKLGYRIMKTRLSNIWQLTGEFDLLDVDNGFYMVKFDRPEDRKKVMDGGPWMIFDHYLAVAPWSKEFISPAAKITKTLAWVRVSGLNVTFYDESFLLSLARLFGNPVRVDMNTLNAERGKFARICVELDLTLPVVGKFWFEGFWYKVVYEGLHIICPKCGCYGHRGRECTQPPPAPVEQPLLPKVTTPVEPPPVDLGADQVPVATQESAESQEQIIKEGVTAEEIPDKTPSPVIEVDPAILEVAGEWMTVTRKHKKKNPSIKGGGGDMQITKNSGTARDGQRVKSHGQQSNGSTRVGPIVFESKKNSGPVMGSIGGPDTLKAPGGKKRRKGEDSTRPGFMRPTDDSGHVGKAITWGPSEPMQTQREELAKDAVTCGAGSLHAQPEMLLVRTVGGGSQIKKLGSNLEGPLEPSGQKENSN
ncbi:uncharacterized protein LOC130724913 [Lotus japonicus]|uniref:uncharacterized protein LOC130724913 n=1 Tax=Lotus japonicus TaxID=34305 RepID=UPI00258F28ED|nr:uncharacterized protein LOC130724913 [Lotus japonicus]